MLSSEDDLDEFSISRVKSDIGEAFLKTIDLLIDYKSYVRYSYRKEQT